jgi:signal transduction histidine kinase
MGPSIGRVETVNQRELGRAYFHQDPSLFSRIPSEFVSPLDFHWRGQLKEAHQAYSQIFPEGPRAGNFIEELLFADYILVSHKIGVNSAAKVDENSFSFASAKIVFLYARFSSAFWTDHSAALRYVRRGLRYSLVSSCPIFLFTCLFMAGHMLNIRNNSRMGFSLAKLMAWLLERSCRWGYVWPPIARNAILVGYPYSMFVANKMKDGTIEETLRNAESNLSNDPYYRNLLVVSGLYGYSYSGNILRTEIYSRRFLDLQEVNNLVRYVPVARMMRLLPYALRGYSPLIKEEFDNLLKGHRPDQYDNLVNSQFYRAAAVIEFFNENFDLASRYITMATEHLSFTQSFRSWREFDSKLSDIIQNKLPVDSVGGKLFRIKREGKSRNHLSSFLFSLISRLPDYFELSEKQFVQVVGEDLAAHLGNADFVVLEHVPDLFMRKLIIPVGGLFLEFSGVSDDRHEAMENMLSILKPGIDAIFKTFREAKRNQELKKNAELGKLASSVAHDIRSPLSALNLVAARLSGASEDQRMLIREASKRINDIANSLLMSRKNPNSLSGESASVELLAPMVDVVVSESRIRCRELRSVSVEIDLSKSYGLFSYVRSTELKRALVNLINNGVEACQSTGKGTVMVSVFADDSSGVIIEIRDDGCGIPPDILDRLGREEISFGKGDSGNGLGVYQAFGAIRSMNGKIEIHSRSGVGTTVRILLPRSSSPRWAKDNLLIPHGLVCVVDDDQSMFEIWKNRLLSDGILSARNLVYFSSVAEFSLWIKDGHSAALYLVDYEFLNQGITGLQAIEELRISRNSVLVTSRHDEADVRLKAEELCVGIIPKTLLSLVPIKTLPAVDELAKAALFEEAHGDALPDVDVRTVDLS